MSTRLASYCCVLTLAISLGVACTQKKKAGAADSHIINGSDDYSDEAVVFILVCNFTRPDDQDSTTIAVDFTKDKCENCTGSLIGAAGSRTVLTAAHCLPSPEDSLVPRDTAVNLSWPLDADGNPGERNHGNPNSGEQVMFVAFEQDGYAAVRAGRVIVVDSALSHPSYVPTGDQSHQDIGLIHLDNETMIDGSSVSLPTPMSVHLASTTDDLNRLLNDGVTFVGYGKADESVYNGGQRRFTSGVRLQIIENDPSELVYVDQVSAECQGDSGGPGIATDDTVVSVTSRDNGTGCTGGIDTRVDAFLGFIRTFMEVYGEDAGVPSDAQDMDIDVSRSLNHLCEISSDGNTFPDDSKCPEPLSCGTDHYCGGARAYCAADSDCVSKVCGENNECAMKCKDKSDNDICGAPLGQCDEEKSICVTIPACDPRCFANDECGSGNCRDGSCAANADDGQSAPGSTGSSCDTSTQSTKKCNEGLCCNDDGTGATTCQTPG